MRREKAQILQEEVKKRKIKQDGQNLVGQEQTLEEINGWRRRKKPKKFKYFIEDIGIFNTSEKHQHRENEKHFPLTKEVKTKNN